VTFPLLTVRLMVCSALSEGTPDATEPGLSLATGEAVSVAPGGEGVGLALGDGSPPPQAAAAVRTARTSTRRSTIASLPRVKLVPPREAASVYVAAMAPTPATVRRSVEVGAPPERVWDLLADLPGMGRLSPENAGGKWVDGAAGPAVGARFRGVNRSGLRRWSTLVQVTECARPHAFAFDVTSLGLAVSSWAYAVAPGATGCTVTETWTDRRGRIMTALGFLVSGIRDRSAFTATSIEHTLAALKSTAEAAPSVTPR
jgi:hypothetical protein